jgi:hypothetical protein
VNNKLRNGVQQVRPFRIKLYPDIRRPALSLEYNNRTYLYGMRWASLIEEYDADQGKDPFAHIRKLGFKPILVKGRS